MYCGSAFAPELDFPWLLEFPTTETGPCSPLTSSFVHTFLVFLTSADAGALASGGCAGEVAEAALEFWGVDGAGLCAKHTEQPNAPQNARAPKCLPKCRNNRVIKPPIPSRAEASSSTLNPVYRTKFQRSATVPPGLPNSARIIARASLGGPMRWYCP